MKYLKYLFSAILLLVIIFTWKSMISDDSNSDWSDCQKSLIGFFSTSGRVFYLPYLNNQIFIYGPDELKGRAQRTIDELSDLVGIEIEYSDKVEDENGLTSNILVFANDLLYNIFRNADPLFRSFDKDDEGRGTYRDLKEFVRKDSPGFSKVAGNTSGEYLSITFMDIERSESDYFAVELFILQIFFPEIEIDSLILRHGEKDKRHLGLIDILTDAEKCSLRSVIKHKIKNAEKIENILIEDE